MSTLHTLKVEPCLRLLWHSTRLLQILCFNKIISCYFMMQCCTYVSENRKLEGFGKPELPANIQALNLWPPVGGWFLIHCGAAAKHSSVKR